MSVKNYGIYVAFPPTVDMRAQGLGRYLAALLNASKNDPNVRFVVACPVWARPSLLALCESEKIDPAGFDILSPKGTPALLRLFNLVYGRSFGRVSLNGGRFSRFWQKLKHSGLPLAYRIGLPFFKWTATNTGILAPVVLSVIFLPLGAVIVIGGFFATCVLTLREASNLLKRKPKFLDLWRRRTNKIARIYRNQKNNALLYALYQMMAEDQAKKLVKLANKRADIVAWYAPAAFWEEFNDIKAPKLMCVPDLVLNDFPVGYANPEVSRYAKSFQIVMRAIEGADHIVTYSEHIKQENVLKFYPKDPDKIHVIRHAPNTLHQLLVDKNGNPLSHEALKALLLTSLKKSSQKEYVASLNTTDIQFIFYASQFRPNKNVITLLRAYKHLLHRKFVSHKLLLTGKPDMVPQIKQFIYDHHLENDVLCLPGLSATQLAACYALADLAVNPSLSEGGCPFTFTEAMSVGTPAVMARIPVTMEVLDDSSLQDVMFFDPYDWQSLADRMEWALANKDHLFAIQTPVYNRLVQRTWGDVVNEHIDILHSLSKQEAGIA